MEDEKRVEKPRPDTAADGGKPGETLTDEALDQVSGGRLNGHVSGTSGQPLIINN